MSDTEEFYVTRSKLNALEKKMNDGLGHCVRISVEQKHRFWRLVKSWLTIDRPTAGTSRSTA